MGDGFVPTSSKRHMEKAFAICVRKGVATNLMQLRLQAKRVSAQEVQRAIQMSK